jgi:murein DD-endopeptidase MepM/ murein hydrolase activator NlpD
VAFTVAVGAGVVAAQTPAWAIRYPTWEDVEKARGDESRAAQAIAELEKLLERLETEVQATQSAAEERGKELFDAREAFDEAAARASSLQQQADEMRSIADEAIREAGLVAAQLYRSGGVDVPLTLFFDQSVDPDTLLSNLGTLSKIGERNTAVYERAVTSRNTAQSLSDQATAARDERERLQVAAADALILAQTAATAATNALAEQEARRIDMEGQLAALRDTSSKTLTAYKEGVEERKRAAAEAAKNNGPGPGKTVSSSGWARPTSGYVSSRYGPRRSPGGIGSTDHRGIDIANGSGVPIFAAGPGTVIYAGWNGGFGLFVEIDHGGGNTTRYAHNSRIHVSSGQRVAGGQHVSSMGATGNVTGPHLHFETRSGGVAQNPETFMSARGVSLG